MVQETNRALKKQVRERLPFTLGKKKGFLFALDRRVGREESKAGDPVGQHAKTTDESAEKKRTRFETTTASNGDGDRRNRVAASETPRKRF